MELLPFLEKENPIFNWKDENYNCFSLKVGYFIAQAYWEKGGYLIRVNDVIYTKPSSNLKDAKIRAERIIYSMISETITIWNMQMKESDKNQ